MSGVLGTQYSLANKKLRTDEEGVPAKSRVAAVGGIARSGIDGRKGQHLPQALAALSQKIYEFMGVRAKISQPVPTRQGGNMQQHPASSSAFHASSPPG